MTIKTNTFILKLLKKNDKNNFNFLSSFFNQIK